MWVVVLLVIVASGAGVAALIAWAGAPPRSIAVCSAAAYAALMVVVGLVGVTGDGCGENGAPWFVGGPFVLAVLVLGPTTAWLLQGRRAAAIAYVMPAFLAALVLGALGLLVVLLTGLSGCR
jgi:hypothetical protein